MSLKWFRKEAKPTPPSDEELLASLFIDPLFKQRIREVDAHNLRGFEGGYAAYRTAGRLVLSEAILPEPDWLVFTHWCKDWDPESVFPGFMLYNKFTPVVPPRDAEEEWIYRQDPEHSPKRRKDVAFYLHSHPRGLATPSPGDVDSWLETEAANPGVVYSILGNLGVHAQILMFRQRTEAAPSYRVIEHSEDVLRSRLCDKKGHHSIGNFMKQAQAVGVNAVSAIYNIDRNRLYPSAKSIAEELTS